MSRNDTRLIIFDPVCGLTIGHNLPTIDKYAEWLSQNFGWKSEAWVATKKNPSKSYLDFKTIPWVYGYWLHDTLKQELKARKRLLKNDSILDILKNSTHHIWAQNRIESQLQTAADLSPAYIFFPGADFYSLLSLLSVAKRERGTSKTIFIVRLMGVMEWATKLPRAREIINQVIFDIKSLLGDRVRFSAETEKYSYQLGAILNSVVPVTSIPSSAHIEIATKRERDYISIACLGGARADKGYFDVLSLVTKTNEVFNTSHGKSIKFTIQSMSSRNLDFDWKYQSDLARSSNVDLIKPRLSDAELNNEIYNADIVLLPYSQGTYESRGSAILFDTLPFGKPLLGTDGTGFGDTIRTAGLGLTYNGVEDYVNRLSDLINLSESKKKEIKRNQENYSQKMLSNLKELFND